LYDGDWCQLYEDFLEAKAYHLSDRAQSKTDTLKKVERLIKLDRLGDATALLREKEAIAPVSVETLEALRLLFPAASEELKEEMVKELGEESEPTTVEFTPRLVRKCLATFKRGAGSGQDGLSADFLKVMAASPESMVKLAAVVEKIALADFEDEDYKTWMTGGVLFALIKPNKSLRPIVAVSPSGGWLLSALQRSSRRRLRSCFKFMGRWGLV
jgi:hypothetical protein